MPQQAVRFAYGWVVRQRRPTRRSPAGQRPLRRHVLPFDTYFIAQAVSDLNSDGTACTFEVTSFTRSVWYTPARGWD